MTLKKDINLDIAPPITYETLNFSNKLTTRLIFVYTYSVECIPFKLFRTVSNFYTNCDILYTYFPIIFAIVCIHFTYALMEYKTKCGYHS